MTYRTSIVATLFALFALGTVSQAAVPAGVTPVIVPQPGSEVDMYVDVEAPPGIACKVGQEIYFVKISRHEAGVDWAVGVPFPIMEPIRSAPTHNGMEVVQAFHCFKAGHGQISITLTMPNSQPSTEYIPLEVLP